MTSRLRRMLSRLAGRRLRAGIRTFIKASSFYDMPCVVGQPGNSKIVVLAPHMDDEVLGCGGTIARHIAAGAKVQIVFLTDGRRGGVVFPTTAANRHLMSLSPSERKKHIGPRQSWVYRALLFSMGRTLVCTPTPPLPADCGIFSSANDPKSCTYRSCWKDIRIIALPVIC